MNVPAFLYRVDFGRLALYAETISLVLIGTIGSGR